MAKIDKNTKGTATYLVVKSCRINGTRVKPGDKIELDADTAASMYGYNRIKKTDAKKTADAPLKTRAQGLPGSGNA